VSVTLSGALNAWTETGMEGSFIGVVTLSPEEAKKNPQKDAIADGQIYFITDDDQLSIFDLSGKLIWEKGEYKDETIWPRPAFVGSANMVPTGIEHDHWANWCQNHFRVTIYLK
jgi:hypothetical protein